MAQMIFSCLKMEWVTNFPRYQTLMPRHQHQQIPLSPTIQCHQALQQLIHRHQHQMKLHQARQPTRMQLRLRDNLQLHRRLMSILILIMLLHLINMKVNIFQNSVLEVLEKIWF